METAARAPRFGSVAEAAGMLESAIGYLAGVDFPGLADAEIAGALRVLERADAVEAVVRGKLVKMFDLSGGASADGHQTAASQAGADEPELARIAAELIAALAPPDEDDDSTFRDRSLRLEDTLDGAGTLRGEMSPECTAALHAVLDVLSRPCGKEDGRTRDERLHDAMHEAMLRLLGARDLLPRKGGAPVTALVHMSLGDLRRLDDGSVMEQAWIDRIRVQWAGHRAAKAETGGDGGAWIHGPAAAGIACDAALFPIVTGNADTSHLRGLIDTCVEYWHTEHAAAASTSTSAGAAAGTAEAGAAAGTAGPVPERAANARLKI